MTPAQLALTAAAALLVCARAEIQRVSAKLKVVDNDPHIAPYSPGKAELPSSCLYNGRWHQDGEIVPTNEECLRCMCAHGALSCRRRACAPLPDPLPRRCHVRHRRGGCCPELHCPDGVQIMEHGAIARFERVNASDSVEVATPPSANVACVEGGSVFAAGSALASRVACEQCFCLGGERRCVRPRCLPPPPHCAPRPAPGACCPQRYYCDTTTDTPNQHRNHYDCLVHGELISEGSPVPARSNCSSCFCLRGAVLCQAMSCAPALAGCRPLRAPGDCCAHQYVCDHNQEELLSHVIMPLEKSASLQYDERAFHSSKSTKFESTTKKLITSLYTSKHSPIASATKNHLTTTTKVKRKTDEPPLSSSQKPEHNTNTTSTNITTTEKPSSTAKLIESEVTLKADTTTEKTTEQPEGTVKIMINGTINCTAELSSTSIPLSITANDTDKIQIQAMPRVPIVHVEAQTYSPNDIITDRNVNGGFDENDTFTINVTSSLMTNTSHSTTRPVVTVPKIPIPADLAEALNISKKKKGEYDYDYTEPTLPPSLPNLKIIPFVAADAVLDDEPSKDTLTYPMLEREDKFPVYYPSIDNKDTYPSRREDTYHPTQYPVFISGKEDLSYPAISHEHQDSNAYPERNDLGIHEYSVLSALGGDAVVSDVKPVTAAPTTTTTTFAAETPAVNLFSPPVETEGGFIPKGAGVLDGYFAVFPSPPPPVVPHIQTSMQLNVIKGECITQDGQHVRGGESVSVGCLVCTCSWVELSCAARACPAPPGCARLPHAAASQDPCCGDLVCHTENQNTTTASPNKKVLNVNETQVEVTNKTSKPPAAVPKVNATITIKTEKLNIQNITTANNNNKPIITTTRAAPTTTTAATTTTRKPTPELTTTTTTTTTPASSIEVNDTSHEYDDDEEEFSFGSVLKLLLSDSYDTTTTTATKKSTTRPPSTNKPTPPTPTPTPQTTPAWKPPTESPFIPLPPRAYPPTKISPNTVNRIDHLVLGEATAIKRTTPRPITNKTTKRPPPQTTTQSSSELKVEPSPFTSAHEGPRPPNLTGAQGAGPGLLKLAGCNIYGRMYRVGRIITELSTPCQECWCTELGVQCKPLTC